VKDASKDGFPFQNISQNTFISAAVGNIKKAGFRSRTRNYNGFRITEISKGKTVFTCIFYKHFFLGSFTPFLIEDAIRTLTSNDYESYQVKTEFAISSRKQSPSIHINYKKLSELLGIFTAVPVNFPLQNGLLTLQGDSSILRVDGLSEPSESWKDAALNTSESFKLAEVVPEQAAFVQYWNTESSSSYFSKSAYAKEIADSLENAFDFDVDQVLRLIDKEVAMIHIESPGNREKRKILVLQMRNMEAALDYFNQLTRRISTSQGDSVYFENYSSNEIRFLPLDRLPEHILGSKGNGFSQCFYVNIKNYLLISNNLIELKELIEQVEEDNTWFKSIASSDFLAQTDQTSSYSIFINIPRAYSLITQLLKKEWKLHSKENASAYTSFEWMALQLSALEDKVFTSITLSTPKVSVSKRDASPIKNGRIFVEKISTKPFLLKTHAHREFDVLLQDSIGRIYYLDEHQNAIWTKDSLQRIVSDVFAMDYYRNGKLQYAFATANDIHLIDRTGNYIPGFPKTISENRNINHLSVIDYDRTRNYRFGISTSNGKTYLTDKDLNQLEGWNPKDLKRPALVPLQHARLGRRDIMLSIQEDGNIEVRTRKGESLRGFPFKTEKKLSPDYFLQQSNRLDNSSLTVLSEDGILLELNLEGDVIRKDQLIRNDAETNFRLISSYSNKSYIIIRQTGNQYDVLDDGGNLLFSKDYLSETSMAVQYYQFGAGRDLVLFIEEDTETLYVYNKSGELVTGSPLKSAHEVSILYSSTDRKVRLFSSWGKNLEIFSFNF
ncbi:MAG: hypothetical protein AAF789_03025, partial [Bacteroidota bacterium]